jgi:RHS repeat-associated protein
MSSGGTTYSYRGGIVYASTNTTDQIEQIATAEGRWLPKEALSSFKPDGTKSVAAKYGRYEFMMKDHLGNNRLAFRCIEIENATAITQAYPAIVTAEYQYDAWGLSIENQMMASSFTAQFEKFEATNRYKYNDKEYISDSKLYDYGARHYDPVVGRWWGVDPKAYLMPAWSPYSFCFNNPLMFVDPDGQIPYPITIRAFAPFNYFGGGFHGDGANRGFTTSSTATARVHQKINFDTDKTTMTTSAWSSPTSHRLLPGSMTETPSVKFKGDFILKQNGDVKTFGFGTHVAGANPMVPGSPNIDVFSNFSITENKKAGTLDISGKLTGDNFPSTEAFVTDPSGQNVFIGVGYYEGSPFSSLDGENKRDISSFNFSISTDKKGNFTGVKMGDKSYSLGDWNKMFQQADPHKNEEK